MLTTNTRSRFYRNPFAEICQGQPSRPDEELPSTCIFLLSRHNASDRAHLRVSAVTVRLPSNKSTAAVSTADPWNARNSLEERVLCLAEGLKTVKCRQYALLDLRHSTCGLKRRESHARDLTFSSRLAPRPCCAKKCSLMKKRGRRGRFGVTNRIQ